MTAHATEKEMEALSSLKQYLRASTNDGRWVSLLAAFPRYPHGRYKGGAQSNAQRQAIRRLHAKGLLVVEGVEFRGDCVRLVSEREMDAETASRAVTIDDEIPF